MEKIQGFVVKRVTGECLVEICPVFSSDGKILFVTTETVVRAYSTLTGEHVRDFVGLTAKAVGVRLHPWNPQLLLACSQHGELLQWKWEMDLPPKKIKLKLPSKKLTVTGFHVAPQQQQHYDVLMTFHRSKKQSVQCVVLNSRTGEDTFKVMNHYFDNHMHSFAVGGRDGHTFTAGILQDRLYIYNLKNGQSQRERIGGERLFTCVSCHPEDITVATGDSTGRVLLFQGCLQASTCVRTVYHWHTLPVTDVTFSQQGSIFYSGGKERVLVKWTVVTPQNKKFLPRMADAIRHITVAQDNVAIAVCVADNGIHVLDAHLKLMCVIQHSSVSGQQDMMQSYLSMQREGCLPGSHQLFPAGIHVDPRSRAVVMNGRVGHVQFVDRHTSRLIYNLDVTGLTYLTQERDIVIANVDVVKLAFSSDGLWFATVEHFEEPGKPATHVRLKFWFFNVVKQIFCLNTTVCNPHVGAVLALQFQPVSPDEPLMAATSGEDRKFKLWIQTESGSIYKESFVWQCDSIGFFKNLPAGPLSFSADGSILSVAFSSTLTLWVPETCQLKCNLTHSKLNSALRHVVFGQLSCCHLVCVATDSCLAVWNLLTLSLDWVVPVQLCALVADPASMLVAAFSMANQLFVFVPSSSEPLLCQSELLPADAHVVCAVFAPHERRGSAYRKGSQLVFLSSNQELMVLEKEVDAEDNQLSALALDSSSYKAADVPTPFTMLLGKQRRTDVEAPEQRLQRHLGEPGKQAVRQLLTTPAHTMISVGRLCQPFLLSFLATKSKLGKKTSGATPTVDDSEADSDDSDDAGAPVNKQEAPVQDQNTKTPFIPEAERRLMEERLEPLLEESCTWVAHLQPL